MADTIAGESGRSCCSSDKAASEAEGMGAEAAEALAAEIIGSASFEDTFADDEVVKRAVDCTA
jgi:hypothetical protein